MKTLLLDKIYQPIAFLSLRRMVKLVFNNKVDVISTWDDESFLKGKYPAVIRLKKYIRKRPRIPRFNRRGVFRRDLFTCMYTGQILPPSQLTVDHVLPKCKGGKSTWENCVTSSLEANAKKGDRTPEEAGMKLIRRPTAPAHFLALEYVLYRNPHPDWGTFFPQIEHTNKDLYREVSDD